MIDDYLNAKRIGSRHVGASGSPKTIKAYRAALQACERLIEKPLETFGEEDADNLMFLMDEEGFTNAYKANILSALRGFFSWAIAIGRYQGSHPFADVATPKANRKLPTILSREDVDRLLAAIPTKKYRLFFQLMYFGGLRIGEVVNLQRRDVANDGIIIRGKGDKQRYVYLPKSIREALEEHMSTNGNSRYVFYAESVNALKDMPLSLVHAYEVFDRAKKDCSLPSHLRPHNLRHTSATHMHAATGDLAMTQKFLGHARPETTVIYAQIADSKMHDAQKGVFGD